MRRNRRTAWRLPISLKPTPADRTNRRHVPICNGHGYPARCGKHVYGKVHKGFVVTIEKVNGVCGRPRNMVHPVRLKMYSSMGRALQSIRACSPIVSMVSPASSCALVISWKSCVQLCDWWCARFESWPDAVGSQLLMRRSYRFHRLFPFRRIGSGLSSCPHCPRRTAAMVVADHEDAANLPGVWRLSGPSLSDREAR